MMVDIVVDKIYNIDMTNDLAYQRDEHRVHLIVFHLVWTPKRRKAVLVGAIAKDCRALIENQCAERGWAVLQLAIQPDHVHLCVRCWPTTSAAEVVKDCKRLTSHALRAKHRVLRKLPSLWTRAYFAATAGHVSGGVIDRYVVAQKGR
jgi:putative transposase